MLSFNHLISLYPLCKSWVSTTSFTLSLYSPILSLCYRPLLHNLLSSTPRSIRKSRRLVLYNMGVVPSTLRLHFLHSLRIPTALTPSSTPYPSEPNGGASLSFPPSPQENLSQQPRPSTPAVDEGSPCRAPYNNNLEEEESHPPYCKSGESDAAPPDVPVELSTPTTEQVGDSPGTTLSDKSPFAFTPSQLASLLGSKDLSALEAIGGVASLFEGLGTDPTRGLCTTRRNARSPQRPTQPQKLKRKKVGPHITPSIICDHMDDMRNPYDATLQERRQVFGENFFSPHANKPCHTTLVDTVMVSFGVIRMSEFPQGYSTALFDRKTCRSQQWVQRTPVQGTE